MGDYQNQNFISEKKEKDVEKENTNLEAKEKETKEQKKLSESFSLRDKIETMMKDIQRLREKRAEKERQELLEKVKKEIPKSAEMPREKEGIKPLIPTEPLVRPEEKLQKETEIPLLPSKPIESAPITEAIKPIRPESSEIREPAEVLEEEFQLRRNWRKTVRKILIRLIFIIIFFGILTVTTDIEKLTKGKFNYWKNQILQPIYSLLYSKKVPVPEEKSKPSEPSPEKIQSSVKPPTAIIQPDYTKVIVADSSQEILDNFKVLFGQNFQEAGLYRVLFKKSNGKFYSGKELFKTFIDAPEEISDLFDFSDSSNFMLFVYNDVYKRMGVIVKIKTEKKPLAEETMRGWENEMEAGLGPLLAIQAKAKDSFYKPFFRQGIFFNQIIRWQTFSIEDFGICYSVQENYLIITTSLESILKVTELLAKI